MNQLLQSEPFVVYQYGPNHRGFTTLFVMLFLLNEVFVKGKEDRSGQAAGNMMAYNNCPAIEYYNDASIH
ncbi:hypothetical protein [Paenibacillus sp. NPDC058174]|uniref:hypothetical protein n=1 Tax=Paenibacillus sp. NPDC058174 TaxID=3346366 RepID=UPI0036DE53B7